MGQTQGFNYFDPEEMRRRRLFDPTSEMGGPEQDNPFTQVTAPDTDEDGDENGGAEGAVKPRPHPALDRFKQVVDQQPQINDYKPSKARKAASIAAGIGLGIFKGPAAGLQMAHEVTNEPYNRATASWQNALKGAQLGVGAEDKEEQIDVNRQRAASYDLSAQARMKTAQAAEQWRRTQEENARQELAIKDRESKRVHNWWETPDTAKTYQDAEVAVHPPRDYKSEEDIKAAHARDLEQLRSQHAMERTKFKSEHPAAAKPLGPAAPKSQEEAEQVALQELLRQDPSVAAFVHKAEVNTKTGKVERTPRVKTADEINEGGGFLGLTGPSEAEKSLKRDQYNQFLIKLNRKKTEVLGRTAAPTWDIQPEEE